MSRASDLKLRHTEPPLELDAMFKNPDSGLITHVLCPQHYLHHPHADKLPGGKALSDSSKLPIHEYAPNLRLYDLSALFRIFLPFDILYHHTNTPHSAISITPLLGEASPTKLIAKKRRTHIPM